MFQFLKNIHFETHNEGKPIFMVKISLFFCSLLLIAFEFSKSVKSIRKLSRSKIKLMFHFLKNIHYETQTEGKTIKTHFLVMRSLEAGQPDGE